jgi:hypothetical protein
MTPKPPLGEGMINAKYKRFLVLLVFIAISQGGCKRVTHLVAGTYSKYFCSCYYVMKHDQSFCEDWAKQSISVSDYSIKQDQHEIHASWLGRTSVARYDVENPNNGCTLVK